jgi:dihydrodipicolinate synthase/N-acetylneuraminate lyase
MERSKAWYRKFRDGTVIPAHPLALTAERKLDERGQRGLSRYYAAVGAGGIAVGVHTTQFAIREPSIGLYEPVLALAADTLAGRDMILIAGVCGRTQQAVREAETARKHGYQIALLSLAAYRDASDEEVLAHVHTVGDVMPLMGFYLQPAVGGRMFSYSFWRRFAEIESVIGIKVAPFNRYATLDLLRGVIDSGRADAIALYTGNDDHIVLDLLSPFHHAGKTVHFRGGLLGHWAVWTLGAVRLHRELRSQPDSATLVDSSWLVRSAEVTDMNAAVFDVVNGFHGCIAGIHEVLRRQGLMQGRWCLNPNEDLSQGQSEEIDRVIAAYPHLIDDDFIDQHRDEWLS